MLEYIHAVNWQSWKDIYAELHPGVNVFIGPSDAGKSSLAIRAPLWVIRNQPQGDQLFRSWSTEIKSRTGKTAYKGETSVELGLSDSVDPVKRYKIDNGINAYSIGSKVFDTPGKTVPDAVSSLLNIQPICIHDQGDGPFLFSMSDPDKARYINELVNLDIIARTQSNIASQLASETAAIKTSEAVVKDKTEQLADYDWVDQADTELQVLESLSAKLETDKDTEQYIIQVLNNVDRIAGEIAVVSRITGAGDKLRELIALDAKVAEDRTLQAEISRLIALAESIQAELNQGNQILSARAELDRLQILLDQYNTNADKELELTNLLNDIERVQGEMQTAAAIYKKAHEDFEREMPITCPLCDQETNRR